MKRTKRLLAIFLSVIMVASIMIMPASAATISTVNWAGAIAGFPELYNGSSQGGYIKFLQRFLTEYNSVTRNYIIDHGGVDGGYGDWTTDAVKVFQAKTGLANDGITGGNTWTKITTFLTQNGAYLLSSSNTQYAGQNVVMFVQNFSTVYLYTFNEYDSRISPYFHSIT